MLQDLAKHKALFIGGLSVEMTVRNPEDVQYG